MQEVRPRTTYGPVDREGTGPLLLERSGTTSTEVTLFEPNVFYATERDQAEYAFHLSAKSWKDEAGLRDDVARLERDRATARREELQKLPANGATSRSGACCADPAARPATVSRRADRRQERSARGSSSSRRSATTTTARSARRSG